MALADKCNEGTPTTEGQREPAIYIYANHLGLSSERIDLAGESRQLPSDVYKDRIAQRGWFESRLDWLLMAAPEAFAIPYLIIGILFFILPETK